MQWIFMLVGLVAQLHLLDHLIAFDLTKHLHRI